MPFIERASGMIIEDGGYTSHGAIVALNLNIPTVVGAKNATQKIDLIKSSNHFVYFSDLSKNLTVYLLIIYLLVTIYGSIYGWWIVKGFLEKMGLIVLIFFTFYLISTMIIKKILA